MPKQPITPSQIDAILPQTQCGLCGYGGCMPYAEALVKDNAAINLCPPGGVVVLKQIAQLVDQDPTPYVQEMAEKTKPKLVASIREDECIGCTKCIQACPVDAILGAAKSMHTVIAMECTGCELCVAPCPVDCIDMLELSSHETADEQLQKANIARTRFKNRQQRLAQESLKEKASSKKSVSASQDADEKKAFVQAAILRAKMKKVDGVR
ncbi:MAG: RnfABCDGE type electron transport complex subunit B [Gammaproteobacteria bacterium]|nr:RnfABCDGE type electron transport complex subunit B [Gammaproteobacteria bacterium]